MRQFSLTRLNCEYENIAIWWKCGCAQWKMSPTVVVVAAAAIKDRLCISAIFARALRFPPMRGTRSSECFVRWPFKTPARETRRALIDWFVSRLLFIFRRSSQRICIQIYMASLAWAGERRWKRENKERLVPCALLNLAMEFQIKVFF